MLGNTEARLWSRLGLSFRHVSVKRLTSPRY